MSEHEKQHSVVLELSNALVSLHKEQFGRGPTRARTYFAGPDITVTVFDDALLPAEKAMVEMGEAVRVQETRIFFQDATRDRFIAAIERITGRKVASFHSTCDARNGIVMEIATLEPRDPSEAWARPAEAEARPEGSGPLAG